MSDASLERVIADALSKPFANRQGRAELIAAAVRAHLLSEATLGRVRDAMDLAFVREEDEARAALTAAME